MEPHKPDLKTVFCEALEHPAGPERLSYLDGACGDNLALRGQVDEKKRSRRSQARGFPARAIAWHRSRRCVPPSRPG